MDGNRFDELTRRLGRGTSRRSLLRNALGAVAVTVGLGSAAGTNAAQRGRPTPTPKPIRCPGQQVPCGSDCCCPDGLTKCEADCCSSTAQCCDGACCDGHCFGEELCCPTGRIVCNDTCLLRGQCCTDADCIPNSPYHRCGVDTPHVCACTTEVTCESVGFNCGPLEDGDCGIIYDCGICTAPQVCGGGGQIGVCGCSVGNICGSDCCDGACIDNVVCCPTGRIVCGDTCLPAGECCTDADCIPNSPYHRCGVVTPHVCACTTEVTCESVGFNCGPLEDGDCGIIYDCGTCTAPETCGGGGQIGRCGLPSA